MEKRDFDVLIIGSDPAGAACAMSLGNSGLSVAILDKAAFPRDKICGDALSVDVLNQLSMLQTDLATRFQELNSKVSSYGVRIFAPDHQYIDLPFFHKGEPACGYLCPRFDFDQLMVEQLNGLENVKRFEECVVERIERTDKEILARTNIGAFTAKLIVGADGAQSVVARQLGSFNPTVSTIVQDFECTMKGSLHFRSQNLLNCIFSRTCCLVTCGYFLFQITGLMWELAYCRPSLQGRK